MNIRILICILLSSLAVIPATGSGAKDAKSPALIVNIVVGGLRYGEIERYGENLSERGLKRFTNGGVVFTECRYDFMQTNSVAGLATITTGCNPDIHGVIGRHWQDYTTSQTVSLIDDTSVQGLNSENGYNRYSPANLTVTTLGDELRQHQSKSKVVTIASDPFSAVAMGGFSSDVYWIDPRFCTWTSSSGYILYLPGWVDRYNDALKNRRQSISNFKWNPSRKQDSYINRRFCIFDMQENLNVKKIPRIVRAERSTDLFEKIKNTPLANELVVEFAKQTIIYEDSGKDSHTDILNICLDASREVFSLYGPESIEAEDMIYRLDREINDLMDFIDAQFGDDRVLFILTSDHGTGPSYDSGDRRPGSRFNGDQFRIMINSFLNSQFGSEEWVSAYYDRRLYLNRSLIYSKGLDLEEIQTQTAAFALQFRGVSHAVTASALQNNGYVNNYLRKIQNGFYPRRSGDIQIDLMQGWIDGDARSSSGSMYDYDTHVPLMMAGCGLGSVRIDAETDMTSLAPTLARIMRLDRPAASTAPVIKELIDMFKKTDTK